MSQLKYDIYEFLIKDKNEIVKKIKPGARAFLAFRGHFGQDAEVPFNLAFSEYITDCLKFILTNGLNLKYDEVSEIIDENQDECIKHYYNKETYL